MKSKDVDRVMHTTTGCTIFFKNKKVHNLMGPAIINPNSGDSFYIEGEYMPFKSWLRAVEKRLSKEAYIVVLMKYGFETNKGREQA